MLGTAVELIGLAAAALDVTLDYIKLRQQFGTPDRQLPGAAASRGRRLRRHRAQPLARLSCARGFRCRRAPSGDGRRPPRRVPRAPRSRSRARALQMHGAIGYTEEHDIGLYYKRAMALAAQYGGELGQVGRFSVLTGRARGSGAMSDDAAHAGRGRRPRRRHAHVQSARQGQQLQSCHARRAVRRGRASSVPTRSVRAIVLRGAGKHFSAGAEVGAPAGAGKPRTSIPGFCRALDAVPKPTVALVHGACIGGAVAMIACCDVVIATRERVLLAARGAARLRPRAAHSILPARDRCAQPAPLSDLGRALRCRGGPARRPRRTSSATPTQGEDALARALDELLLAGPNAAAHAKALLRRLAGEPITPELLAELQAEFDQRFRFARGARGPDELSREAQARLVPAGMSET